MGTIVDNITGDKVGKGIHNSSLSAAAGTLLHTVLLSVHASKAFFLPGRTILPAGCPWTTGRINIWPLWCA